MLTYTLCFTEQKRKYANLKTTAESEKKKKCPAPKFCISAEGFKEGGGVVGVRLLLADRMKLFSERLERTYTNHTSYSSPCLKPSAQNL